LLTRHINYDLTNVNRVQQPSGELMLMLDLSSSGSHSSKATFA
jgi:hypothetical protein